MGNKKSVPTLDSAIHFVRQGHLLCLALQCFIEWPKDLKDEIGLYKNVSEGLINVSPTQLLWR